MLFLVQKFVVCEQMHYLTDNKHYSKHYSFCKSSCFCAATKTHLAAVKFTSGVHKISSIKLVFQPMCLCENRLNKHNGRNVNISNSIHVSSMFSNITGAAKESVLTTNRYCVILNQFCTNSRYFTIRLKKLPIL